MSGDLHSVGNFIHNDWHIMSLSAGSDILNKAFS